MFSDNDNLKNNVHISSDDYRRDVMIHIMEAAQFIARQYIGMPNNEETRRKFNMDLKHLYAVADLYAIDPSLVSAYIKEDIKNIDENVQRQR